MIGSTRIAPRPTRAKAGPNTLASSWSIPRMSSYKAKIGSTSWGVSSFSGQPTRTTIPALAVLSGDRAVAPEWPGAYTAGRRHEDRAHYLTSLPSYRPSPAVGFFELIYEVTALVWAPVRPANAIRMDSRKCLAGSGVGSPSI